MTKPTKRDRESFAQYLQQCTDSQVLGVLAKEQKAGRRVYVRLARIEADKRGLCDGR